ncbi:MAG: glycosyltransferase family 39 protein [Bacillota bacterium]
MKNINKSHIILGSFVFVSFLIKLILIFKYQNNLTLSSDDLNYIKSAVVLIKRGIYIFHNLNEPTVFVTPLYPFFLAAIFKVFGFGLFGLQMVRIIQAVISSITIIIIFLLAREFFNTKIALISSFLASFYIPNIVTVGYMLTETIFTMLLCLLIYLSIIFGKKPGVVRLLILALVWTAATLCRPTIALYPVMLFIYLFFYRKMKLLDMVKYGTVMFIVFMIIMSPWWIRNYLEYGEFIPLAASSGNPMLQGTYIDYKQTPENIVYYSLGKNAFETNKTEVAVSKMRIKQGFIEDFWGYLKWYTLGKTYLFWFTAFYWKQFFNISSVYVIWFHYVIIISAFLGITVLLFKKISKYILLISVILYFNVVHCVYMAFDRYAFPLISLLSVFSAYFIYLIYNFVREIKFKVN